MFLLSLRVVGFNRKEGQTQQLLSPHSLVFFSRQCARVCVHVCMCLCVLLSVCACTDYLAAFTCSAILTSCMHMNFSLGSHPLSSAWQYWLVYPLEVGPEQCAKDFSKPASLFLEAELH